MLFVIFVLRIVLLPVAVLLFVVWLGLRIKPHRFPNFPGRTPELERTVPLPTDLPVPVARFYRTAIGEHLPVIDSAVMTLSGTLQFGPVKTPARMRFIHRAGYDYRHYIEVTWFGRALLRVNERYRGGKGYMQLPMGTFEDEPTLNAAANQGLWGETLWLPSLFITDARVRWEAGDDPYSARLIVPYPHDNAHPEQVFTVHFDPDSGLIDRMQTMRYRDVDSDVFTPWTLTARDWKQYNGMLIPVTGTVQWGDQSYPWMVARIDDIVYNVDVEDAITRCGL